MLLFLRIFNYCPTFGAKIELLTNNSFNNNIYYSIQDLAS